VAIAAGVAATPVFAIDAERQAATASAPCCASQLPEPYTSMTLGELIGALGTRLAPARLPSLTRAEARDVAAVTSMTPATLSAVFGRGRVAGTPLAGLTPKELRYLSALTSMTADQLAATFSERRTR
jgi:hypothetical protein